MKMRAENILSNGHHHNTIQEWTLEIDQGRMFMVMLQLSKQALKISEAKRRLQGLGQGHLGLIKIGLRARGGDQGS